MAHVLHEVIESLPATRPATIKLLASIGIKTFLDLLEYVPSRYENYAIQSPIARIQPGELVTITGIVSEMKSQYARRITIQKATITDSSGTATITWFNQPYLTSVIKKDALISVAGLAQQRKTTVVLEPKEYEVIKFPNQTRLHTGRLVATYPEKRGLSSRTIREKINYIIDRVLPLVSEEELETVPKHILETNNLLYYKTALQQIHQPQSNEQIHKARARYAFEEMFAIQLSAALIRQSWEKEIVGSPFKKLDQKKINKFIEQLPFKLTNAQIKVVDELVEDLRKDTPMNRFVQGDVGSGKTVIAAIGSYLAHLNGYQSLIMAPTEILAKQHFNTISKLLEKQGITVGLQTGSTKMLKKSKAKLPELPHYDVLVGTHALISKSVQLSKVGLVVIDEQHRFGVAQRAMLKQKGINPHLLTMTATPIPRTVALTIYGELDLSVVNEMPKGRLPIKTYLVPQSKREDAYKWIKERITKEKSQVFIICPLIEESETETLKSIKAASKEYERLKTLVFKEQKVGLLHGKMKAQEKDEVMQAFKNHEYHILVSTSVVEVGIDIPNATVMVIEGAQRFGLAQLHQLRGRVGRGEKQSYCLLFTDTDEPSVKSRLGFFAKTNSGIELAEYDMKLRGPGSIYGVQQHGYTEFKVANFADLPLIKKSKSAVDYFVEHHVVTEFPVLKQRLDRLHVDEVARD